MRRVDLYLSQEQVDFLKNLPGTISEHIRKAVDEYIDKLHVVSASASASVKKEVEFDE